MNLEDTLRTADHIDRKKKPESTTELSEKDIIDLGEQVNSAAHEYATEFKQETQDALQHVEQIYGVDYEKGSSSENKQELIAIDTTMQQAAEQVSQALEQTMHLGDTRTTESKSPMENSEYQAVSNMIDSINTIVNKRLLTADNVIQHIESSNLLPTEKAQLYKVLVQKHPSELLYHFPDLDKSTAGGIWREMVASLIEKDPLLLITEGRNYLTPPPVPEDMQRAFDRACVIAPFRVVQELDITSPRIQTRLSEITAQMIQQNPLQFIETQLYQFSEFVSPQQLDTLIEASKKKRPELLLRVENIIALSPEQRQLLLQECSSAEHAHQFVDLVARGSIDPSPEEAKTIFDKLVQTHSEQLLSVLEYQPHLITEDQRNHIFNTILQQSPQRITELLIRTPSVRTFLETAPLDQLEQELPGVIVGLSDRFLYSFQQNPSHAKTEQLSNRTTALQLIEHLSPQQAQEVLPVLIESVLDPDFGNTALAEYLIQQLEDVRQKEKYTHTSVEQLHTPEERVKRLDMDIQERSMQNRDRMYTELVGQNNKEDVDALIARIQATHFLSINASIDSVERILNSGRVKSDWEIGGKQYHDARNTTERTLGIRAKGTEKDPHPIYAAMGYRNNHDEIVGPARHYGDCFFVLKPEVESRSVCTFGDSLNYRDDLPNRQLTFQDAMIGRAKLELDGVLSHVQKAGYEYVEAQIIGGVNRTDIEKCCIPQQYQKDPNAMQRIKHLQEQYPDISFEFV